MVQLGSDRQELAHQGRKVGGRRVAKHEEGGGDSPEGRKEPEEYVLKNTDVSG